MNSPTLIHRFFHWLLLVWRSIFTHPTPSESEVPPMKRPHLHVLTGITNPVGYKSRPALCKKFLKHVDAFDNVTVWVAEGVYEGKEFEVTEAGHPHHLQLHIEHEIWHKENLLNLLVEKLTRECPDWEYVAWIDADVVFARPDWVDATLHQLTKHPVVQMFSECADLDSHYQLTTGPAGEHMRGMVYSWMHGQQTEYKNKVTYGGRPSGHCGYAWACTREAWDIMGGLIDVSVVGSADFQMACALMGDIEDSIKYDAAPGYRQWLREWGERCRPLNGRVGYVHGLILHNWHGPKYKRGYEWRVRILVKNRFDPYRDLRRDHQGVICWNTEHPDHAELLQQNLVDYFRHRNEDLKSCNCGDKCDF
jgi:hypothetical protein